MRSLWVQVSFGKAFSAKKKKKQKEKKIGKTWKQFALSCKGDILAFAYAVVVPWKGVVHPLFSSLEIK